MKQYARDRSLIIVDFLALIVTICRYVGKE